MNQEIIKNFSESSKGNLIQPTDIGYDEARKVYNGMIDKHPAIIIECVEVEDVIGCINFARENNLLAAVRGGGHSVGGLGICDDGLVIDLSKMKKITLDTTEKTVRVEGGCLLKELDAATHEIGMAVPSGIFGTTGVAGLTLGGGLAI